ncbi:HAMP domain-containing sensor histidine kinase [Curtobacterium sp. MCBD17_008]|uniref:sensor histidine kinase n=1 Tax=Curtobacterium sp. MCBD17_008 TaxID=2175656 RepID=UPI000DA736FD|nr:HAMP domain-containing sensor histidine kinase [Curtobacterium sp. MCBD17_008]PZE91667.1 two-component sensor histidine kinase [Curtobacterium sp. MCBD17_008]
MTRTWSIRARTALAFALTAMALAAGTVAVVNLGSQASLQRAVLDRQPGAGHADGVPAVGPDSGPATAVTLDGSGGVQVVAVVAGLQWQWSVLGVTGAGVLAGGIGWAVSRRMLAPVDRITATARRISASTLHERIALDGPDDELRRLAHTIDDLLDRLEDAFASQRRFVAQASHELRTPLAVQRAALQIGLPDDAGPADVARTREELLEQNRRTEHLVESLLVLAEADRGLDGRTVAVDLVALVDDVAAEHRARAETAGLTLTCRTEGGPPGRVPPVQGEPVLLRQALRNLVDNAIEYNVPGGSVRVTVDAAGVLVENDGPEVRATEVARLTEPFRRGGTTAEPPSTTTGRRHSGLGLSIVAAVVRAHGWVLAVDPRDRGGLVVRIGVSSV